MVVYGKLKITVLEGCSSSTDLTAIFECASGGYGDVSPGEYEGEKVIIAFAYFVHFLNS